MVAAVGSRSLARSKAFADTLGTVTTVLAEYGEYFERSHRIFDPALAGEAAAVARAIAAGQPEVPQRTLASSIVTLEAADEIRRQIGMEFPAPGHPTTRGAAATQRTGPHTTAFSTEAAR